jgi:hypothetical protein
MANELNIHIFCVTPEICLMISKYLSHTKHLIQSTHLKNPEADIFLEINYTPDCIILDSQICTELKIKIKEKYPASKIIYLPSLDDKDNFKTEGDELLISEPLKLSELEEIINKCYDKKNAG